ncbi:SRPBCC family protein [Steroidobacter cummioxidans]|uniref:SRPBCC family protein n=1 Tax=Steroidobacter cummioxidans TaxID=1803913 RepID=UPI001379AC16|nr:SRPBCC domain-containing protein [Steroidobacter cummioxidans]
MMSKNPHFPVKTSVSARCTGLLQGWARVLGAVLLSVAAGWSQVTLAAEPQVTEGFINASPAEVWRIFTTAEGYKRTGVAAADVDFRIGGTIRTHYDPKGQLGDAHTIVNEILAYEPERMLATRIKQAPADFKYPDAIAGTWTVIYLAPAGDGMTQVRIVGLGYTDAPQSQAMRKFFADGNRWTLDHIAKPYWPKCAKCMAEEAAQSATP